MSKKFKDFITQQKTAALRKALQDGKMPEQGSFVSLYNNNYKVLTKADSKITILEDNKANKFAYPRDAFIKMLTESTDTVQKADAHYGKKPTNLVGHIGQNAKPGGAAPAATGAAPKNVDPVGTVRNGRKKIVSKRSGQTMWVNVATGEGHAEHDSPEVQPPHPDTDAQAKDFFNSTKDSLHPGDKLKLQRQMKELIAVKQKMLNLLDMAHQEDRIRAPEAKSTREKVFAMQDKYKHAFKQFEEGVKSSATKRAKENKSEA